MRHAIYLILSFTLVSVAQGKVQTFQIDGAHSQVKFEISHLIISKVEGQFKKFQGKYRYDKKSKKVSDIQFSIDAKSIDTNEKDRDEHLRGNDFFKTKKFPKIEFKNAKVKFEGTTPKSITGDLSIAGKSKKVNLRVKWKGEVTDPWGNQKQVFELQTQLKRSDFGLTWNKTLDKGGVMIGEEVDIMIRIQANLME